MPQKTFFKKMRSLQTRKLGKANDKSYHSSFLIFGYKKDEVLKFRLYFFNCSCNLLWSFLNKAKSFICFIIEQKYLGSTFLI